MDEFFQTIEVFGHREGAIVAQRPKGLLVPDLEIIDGFEPKTVPREIVSAVLHDTAVLFREVPVECRIETPPVGRRTVSGFFAFAAPDTGTLGEFNPTGDIMG